MMEKITLKLVMVLTLVFGAISSASAITNGVPDNGRHPYVGLIIFDVRDANGDQVVSHRCTGSLLTPTVVLTAGHCTDGTVAARIWLDENVQGNTEYPHSGVTSYEGVPYTYTGYCVGCKAGLPGFLSGDVGIIVLTEPVPAAVVGQYAALPVQGVVDTLPNKTPIDLVGYGVQEQIVGRGPPVWAGLRHRLFATSELISGEFAHSDQFIKIAMNPGGGSGGICFGDSGGPVFLANTRTVLAVVSYGASAACAGAGYSARVDTPSVLAWLNGFLP